MHATANLHYRDGDSPAGTLFPAAKDGFTTAGLGLATHGYSILGEASPEFAEYLVDLAAEAIALAAAIRSLSSQVAA